MDIRSKLIAQANKDKSNLPQYKGHFDNYILVKIKKKQKGKLGESFHSGQIAIANPIINESNTMSVYSTNTSIITSVRCSDIEIL